MSSPVQYDLIDEIGVIAIDNPPVNALSAAVRKGIVDALETASGDASKAILIICRGRTFCAGADITELEGNSVIEAKRFAERGQRVFAKLDTLSIPSVAVINGYAFGGGLELALACDRSYQLALPDDEEAAPRLVVDDVNFGLYPMITDESRLQRRFYGEQPALDAIRAQALQPLDADAAFALGLVTSNPDDLDWDDEVRIAIEERVSMSPDALTGMEANLRFNGRENMFTRIFGRLTAWQNWIFQRPNAVGESGALKVYGSGVKSAFDWNRV